jgi:hypothetical protein
VKKDDERILAAVKLIHVMAKDAPAEFNAQLESFLKTQNHGDDIPPLAVALFHSDIVVRRAASVALASCFDLAREMNNIKQQRWTHYMWEASQIYLNAKYVVFEREARDFFSYLSNTTSITHEIENNFDHIPQILRR